VLAGQFDDDIKLFGKDIVAARARFASVPLRAGGFLVALDASGAATQTQIRLGLDGYADLAVDRHGSAIVTGTELVDQSPPFRAALLDKLVLAGSVVFERSDAIGAGHAVAVDACGAVLWSASLRDGGPDQPFVSRLFKIAP
jgi:hypothetical protein